jgi:Pyruvate/2-oxoacid:ferredoxin oxidoreductase delta subunit
MARYKSGGTDGMAQEGVKFSDLNPAYFQRKGRKPNDKLPVSPRTSDFREICSGLSTQEALEEARRCFNCGVCNLCDNCFIFCPDMAIAARPDKQGYEINYEYCKGCCICVEECPRGAISVEVRK